MAAPFTLTITRELTEQQLKDLLVTAVEGGSNYWATFKRPTPSHDDYTEVDIEEHDAHGDAPRLQRRISFLTMLDGLRALAEAARAQKFPTAAQHLNDAIEENGDATTADVVLQMALFGDVIYG